MKEKFLRSLYFSIIFGTFHCYESDFYTLKAEYQNKTYQETPTFDKISFSLIECSAFCSGTPGCNIIFFNKISGKCEAFQKITDVNNFAYSDNTDVFEKAGDQTVTTEAPIATTRCPPYTTSECGISGYIKIDTTTNISPCFKVYTLNDRKSHPLAKAVCQSENSRLIVLSDSNLLQLIGDYVSCVYDDISQSTHFWLGLEYSFDNGQWVWFNNNTHLSWSYTSDRECGMMFKSGDMYPGYCPAYENFICESLAGS